MYCYLERCDQGLSRRGDGELFKIKLGGFTQICKRFLDRFALSGCSRFGIERGETAFRGWNKYCGKNHVTPSMLNVRQSIALGTKKA